MSSHVISSSFRRMTKPSDFPVRLREGKNTLRQKRRSMSLPEKVQQVIVLQSAVLPLLRKQRALRSWERVWDVEAGVPSKTGR